MASTIHDLSSSSSPLGSADLVGDAVALLRPKMVVRASLHLAGSWALGYAPVPHVRIAGMVRGGCWLVVDGAEPVRVQEGDVVLISTHRPFRLASSLTAEPADAEALWRAADGDLIRIGAEGAEDTVICSGCLAFDPASASLLTDLLPPLVHVRADDPRGAELATLTTLLTREVDQPALGGPLVVEHLAQILLVHLLRAHADRTSRPSGWLAALADDGVGAALRAMHADVAHRWTVQELAASAHMSRSAFAADFRRKVGLAPLEYLIGWRMRLASDALRRDTHSISELAAATGYESESAFSTAFRRVVGLSPKHFRDRARCVEE